VSDLVTVHLSGFPLLVWSAASEHHEGLMREFALVSLDAHPDGEDPVPRRLRALIDRLRGEYGSFTQSADEERDRALAEGRETIDLIMTVPRAARLAVDDLDRLLDEVDAFCRDGDLLTMATPPQAVAFRRWYLGEFRRQIDGEPPTPWQGSSL